MVRDIIILEKNKYILNQYNNLLNYKHYMSWGIDSININKIINNDISTNYNILNNIIN